jgi:hypothetical protein
MWVIAASNPGLTRFVHSIPLLAKSLGRQKGGVVRLVREVQEKIVGILGSNGAPR